MLKKTLGSIVTRYPNTVHVMNTYKLDYCCGGGDVLEDALKALALDSDVVIKALNSAIENQDIKTVTDWNALSLSEIIDYILNNHHVFMKEALSDLNMMVFKLLKVHFKSHGESLLQIHYLFGTLKTELEAHLVKEEEFLFPLIREYELTQEEEKRIELITYIKETENEHDAAGDLFKALEIATNHFTLPENVCMTYEKTYKLLDALEKDTFNHIHLENTILFNRL